VQEAFKRDPHGGHLYVLRGKSSHLIKIIDGIHWRNPRLTFRPQREDSRDQWPGIKFFYLSMNSGLGALPDGVEALKAAPVAARGERISLDMFPNTAARASMVSTKMARPSPIMASSA
jgi:hypothetical protein